VSEERETGEKTEVLARGRELAAAILAQLERFYLAPGNREEGKRLDLLQGEFVGWERQIQIRFPDIDPAKEFPDARLRPPPPKNMDQRAYLFKRRQWTVSELRDLPYRLEKAKKTTHADSGMWGGTWGI